MKIDVNLEENFFIHSGSNLGKKGKSFPLFMVVVHQENLSENV